MVKAVRQKLLKQGILLRPLGNTLYLMPPLITPDRLLSKTIDLLAEILSTTM
jgi:adenosylmethionine-8-amino-7-oxononanoate aminotransferase